MSKKRKNEGISRPIEDPFSMSNSSKALLCKDQCVKVQEILLEVISTKKSLHRSTLKSLNHARELLNDVVTHLSASVPWHERMAYERLKKRQAEKHKMGATSEPKKELCPTKKRPKRKAKVAEEMRRQKDGRAAMVAVSKMRSAMKVFFPGESKPSTPKEIGHLLQSAAK